jgi:hypothetical protein
LNQYGYRPDGQPLPLEYLSRVTSIRNRATVISPLQEDILLRVDSRWEPLVPMSLLLAGQAIVQALTKGRRSLISRATSRRIWTGTSPMVLSLKMRFEAVENAANEVREPVRILQSIALPSEPWASGQKMSESNKDQSILDSVRGYTHLPMLSPPGPTPFTLTGIINRRDPSHDLGDTTSLIEGLKGGDKIMIELGRFLTFYNVIVRNVSAIVPIKFDTNGDPISATVNVVFETYEIMTAESLQHTYKKTAVSGANTSQGLGGLNSKIVNKF